MRESNDRRDWESWIDQQIREAQARGAFDNLPGKGKPIDLTSNPYAQDRELAFKILKDAGYAPEWIELDKTIRGRTAQARATLAPAWEWHNARLAELHSRTDSWAAAERARVESSWENAADAFQQEIQSINGEIADLNLKVPAPRFQRARVDAEREIAALTGRQG